MGKKIKTRKFLRDSLNTSYLKGKARPKHKYKDEHNATPYIHSKNTYQTYKRECDKFSNWAHENGYTNPKIAQKKIPDYLKNLEASGKSAWTIQTAMNGIAKGYQISTLDIPYNAPTRSRSDITRSRHSVASNKHFSRENNADLIRFEQCFGLRKNKELKNISAKDFHFENSKLYCSVKKGKGGKPREVPFVGSHAQLKKVVKTINGGKGRSRLFNSSMSHYDAHHDRAIYACKLYRKYEQIYPELDYHCRKDKKGDKYSRKALEKVSIAMGHNRACVVVDNYMYALNNIDDEEME